MGVVKKKTLYKLQCHSKHVFSFRFRKIFFNLRKPPILVNEVTKLLDANTGCNCCCSVVTVTTVQISGKENMFELNPTNDMISVHICSKAPKDTLKLHNLFI